VPLPSFPVLPQPRDWSPDDLVLVRHLRDDVTNSVQLGVGMPLVIAQQTLTGQSVPQNAVTPLDLDTEMTDTWQAHQIPNPHVVAPLPGWYLTEGIHTTTQSDASSVTTAGLRFIQNGTQDDVYGAQTSCAGNPAYQPSPGVADLVKLNGTVTSIPFTASSATSVFTAPGSAYFNNAAVYLASAGGTLPGGFAPGVVYYVVAASGATFQLSGAPGGAPTTVITTGSGTVQATDTIALTAVQTSATVPTVSSASLTVIWTGAPSGTVVANPQPPVLPPPGSGVMITAGIAAGATILPVTTAQGMLAGGTLGLDAGSPVGEQVTITNVSGTTISTTPTAYPHAAGAAVAVPVSAAWANQEIRDRIRMLAYPPMARMPNTALGSAQSVPSQAFPAGTAIEWAQGSFHTGAGAWLDNYGGWSSSNPTRYTFPVAGVWYLYGQVSLDGSSAAGAWSLAAGFRYNGGSLGATNWGDVIPAVPLAASITATVRRQNRVSAGDYVEVMASQGSGISLPANFAGAAQCRLVAIWRGF
jgi:hypothetical protein